MLRLKRYVSICLIVALIITLMPIPTLLSNNTYISYADGLPGDFGGGGSSGNGLAWNPYMLG